MLLKCSEKNTVKKDVDIMVKKFVVYIVSVLTMTIVQVALNKMILLAVGSFLSISELTLSFCHAMFSSVLAVISIFYGLAVVLATDRNDK